MMDRVFYEQTVDSTFINKLIEWLGEQEVSFCFRGHGWGSHHKDQFDAFAGAGIQMQPPSHEKSADFIEENNDYIFSAIPYDFKNELEKLTSNNLDEVGFDAPLAFIPNITFHIKGDSLYLGYLPQKHTLEEIKSIVDKIELTVLKHEGVQAKSANPTHRISREAYLEGITACKQHLKRGDIYQANICQEFYWPQCQLHAPEVFIRGFESNPNPFSVYFKYKHIHCISWSPERFLSINGREILSQPMKGTAPRGGTSEEDMLLMSNLKNSEKDRRENVMIVDMVRNDLSAHSAPGSVSVPQLYTIETYPRVHQMHSTVTAQMKKNARMFDAILAAFPMASMTGAPKIRAMEIIENIEHTKRGLFSGTIGFFTPNKNADFNVVIRSLLYNEAKKYLSCHVGGGITDLSDANAEYEECLVKLAPITDLIQALYIGY